MSSDICVRFGKRLRTLRKEREWTQVYMAEHVGMDRSFISDLENGEKEICVRNLEVLVLGFKAYFEEVDRHRHTSYHRLLQEDE